MMADIYDNKITYTHDGSDTLRDELKFTVSDGTNPLYKVQSDDGEITVSRPQVSGRCLEALQSIVFQKIRFNFGSGWVGRGLTRKNNWKFVPK